MEIFSNILSKLGFGSAQASEPTAAPAAVAPATPSMPADEPAAASSHLTTVSMIDVVGQLETMAEKHPEKLNWKTSIVDLLKLLGLDSSLSARKELATELSCPAEKMNDSAQMNIWLHKTVLKKLADNGGNIPADLL